MPKMLMRDRLAFPHLAKFIQIELPARVTSKQKVWHAFRDKTQLNWLDSFRYLKWQQDSPLLIVKKLGTGTNGFFENQTPQVIYLSKDIAHRFEHDRQLEPAKLCVESTVLHELVHVADFRDGHHTLPELGIEFEKAAYGRNIGTWWIALNIGPAINRADLNITATGLPQSSHHIPRGILHNNPGNIKRSGFTWLGQASTSELTQEQRKEHELCVFTEAAWGIRAMCTILFQYRLQGARTILDFVRFWAPQKGAYSAEKYAKFIANPLDLDHKYSMPNLDDEQILLGFLQSMIQFENNQQPYADLVFLTAFNKLNN